jgi:hypothetical protein
MLWTKEQELLLEMLYWREEALAWDFCESSWISYKVIPPVTINTVLH